MGAWWWELTYRVGPNLWVIPLCMGALSLVLFAVTRWFDVRVDTSEGYDWLPEFLIVRAPADAFVVLSALLAALATALALVFSTSVLTFSLASSQLGPRLIRRFIQDPVTQVTLGALLSGVLLCVLTLGSVRTGGGPNSVPSVSYAVTVVVSVLCFVLIVIYVHRVATSIQSPRVVASVVRDLDRSMAELDRDHRRVGRFEDESAVADVIAAAEESGAAVEAGADGFVQVLDIDRILAVATRTEHTVVMLRRPGQFVVVGQPIALVLPAEGVEPLGVALREAIEIGDTRTRRQDLEFALYQVVEIGLRAQSAAINDTFTAMTCIDWLTAALCRLGRREPETGAIIDEGGVIRLVERPVPFARQVRASYDMLRQAGADNPAIIIRLLDSLTRLATTVRTDHLEAVGDQAEATLASGLSTHPVPSDADEIRRRFRGVTAAIAARDGSTDVTEPGSGQVDHVGGDTDEADRRDGGTGGTVRS